MTNVVQRLTESKNKFRTLRAIKGMFEWRAKLRGIKATDLNEAFLPFTYKCCPFILKVEFSGFTGLEFTVTNFEWSAISEPLQFKPLDKAEPNLLILMVNLMTTRNWSPSIDFAIKSIKINNIWE